MAIRRESGQNAYWYLQGSVNNGGSEISLSADDMRYNGQGWIQISLLFDGKGAQLYLNERPIGNRVELDRGIQSLGDSKVRIGPRSPQSGLPYGIVDNVLLNSIGKDRPTRFPQFMKPAQDYRILVDATGVNVFNAEHQATSEIVLDYQGVQSAVIISTTGRFAA